MKPIIKEKQNYKQSRYIQFGNYMLNHFQLENNILLLKTLKSFGPVYNLRRTVISDDLKSLISEILHTGEINIDLQKDLSLDDTLLFEKLLKVSKLTDTLNYKRQSNNLDDIINRFEVLRGGLIAGNQSLELKKELQEIITILIKYNKINENKGFELIEILN